MRIKLLCAVVSATVLAGCGDEREGVSQVRITPRIETRVTGLHFDSGDCIGLTVNKNAQVYADNVQMTYDGAEFSGSVIWYSDQNEKSTLIAYHPYHASGMPTEFSIATDQSQGCASSDLLAAFKTDVTPVSTAVNMVFRHLFSQLTILIDNTSSGNVSEVVVDGLIPTAEVDYSALHATVKSGAASASVKTFPESAGTRHKVILVPQSADLKVIVHTDNAKSYEKVLPLALLEGGKKYDLGVKLTDAEINLVLSGDIEDWEPGGDLGGGGGGSGSNPGDEGDLDYQGEKYRTTTIGDRVWMADNLRYVPTQSVVGSNIWYPCKDGVAGSDPAYVRQKGMLYSYALAGKGAPLGSVAVQGICPDGWHIPTSAELAALGGIADFDYASFLTLAGAWSSGTGKYVAETKGYLMSCSPDAVSGYISALMCSLGGAPTMGKLAEGSGFSLRCVKN